MAHTYILYSSKLDRYYVGSCPVLGRRFYEHNPGHSAYTRKGVPWDLMYTEEYATLLEARRRERPIKRMKSRTYIEALIAKGRASRF